VRIHPAVVLVAAAGLAIPAAASAPAIASEPDSVAVVGPPRLRSAFADTLGLRLEIGGSSDFTNEIYYLDSLASPTLAVRQRFEIPEARHAGVVLASLEGTRAGRGTHYALTQELSLGDLLKRASVAGRWRQTLAPGWRLFAGPRLQYRRDRTLGRDFEEFQAAGSARLRRSFGDGQAAAELGVLGDWLSTTGSGAALLLDRWSAGASGSLEQSDFRGVDGRIDYVLRGRVFPDSGVRDHLEHQTQGRLRLGWGIADFAVLDAAVIRRVTLRAAPTSQDNFWEESGALDLVFAAAADVAWPARLAVESVQFDVEDDVIYFDHHRFQARAGARFQPERPWTLELGPLGEWLEAPRAGEESYVEFGAFSEFEAIAAGTLWSVTPSAGHRRYRAPSESATVDPYGVGRSSYRFVQLDLLGDQRLPGGWRARVAGSTRWELHDESVENAASLYFSLDVRRLF